MADRAYDYMDWPKIEGIIYSDQKHPKSILAPRVVKEGILLQGFFPEIKKVRAVLEDGGHSYEMKMEDEAGYFAAVIPGKKIPPHHFLLDGETVGNPYAFPGMITSEEEGEFCAGICYDIWKKLGAHPAELCGTKGVSFAVWAPNAVRVSVVGPFNGWDGRVNPMEMHEDSGIYELFIPYLEPGTVYKYELKLAGGLTYLKTDPYGNAFEIRPRNASVVADLSSYRWHDREYLHERKEAQPSDRRPLAIYEMNLSYWKTREDGSYYSYRELAPMAAAYLKSFGYTHAELMPVMEYPDDSTSGYQTTGYYAPTSRYGNPDDFKFFIDTLHKAGLGVILDWTPAQFSADENALPAFDGTCLYEHLDPRQGTHPLWGTKLWNYGRPQVKNFLIANALFWLREYHADGLRMDGVSTILRLDYGRADGQWVPNMYGSCENLDGIEFLKHLNSIVRRQMPDTLLIVEEDIDWPDTTGPVDESHLGFDYKWNLHFTEDVLAYFSCESGERCAHHDALTDSMLYNYADRFILSLSRDITLFDPQKLMDRMPGTEEEKKANLRAAYAFMTAHPGKKLFSEGEEFQPEFFKDLLALYASRPALYEEDYLASGFEWINTLDAERCALSFLRKTDRPDDTLLVVCNFSSETLAKYQVGVPYCGTYKEIFNTDSRKYGGKSTVSPRAKESKEKECDERKNSIYVKLAPYSVSVFACHPEERNTGR